MTSAGFLGRGMAKVIGLIGSRHVGFNRKAVGGWVQQRGRRSSPMDASRLRAAAEEIIPVREAQMNWHHKGCEYHVPDHAYEVKTYVEGRRVGFEHRSYDVQIDRFRALHAQNRIRHGDSRVLQCVDSALTLARVNIKNSITSDFISS